jgi:hypothetical protein
MEEPVTKSNSAMGCLELIGTKIFPIMLSVISLVLSTFNLYVSSLRAPNISFAVAPYMSHVVDNNSGNEAFFIPLTAINRGARPGTVLSFELTVTELSTQNTLEYFGQYFAKSDDQKLIGDLFSPMTIQGYSTDSKTVAFYPLGFNAGKILANVGVYEFTVKAATANINNSSQKNIDQTFRITLTDEMDAALRATPDGEYPFPIKIDLVE